MAVSLPSYDTTKVSSLSLSASQVGYGTSLGDWTEGSLPFSQTSWLWYTSFTFDFSVSNDSERGLALAPRLPFTSATNDLAGTGETAETWDLTLSTAFTSVPFHSAVLYGVVSHTPTNFSTSNNPYGLVSTAGSSYIIDTITGDGAGTNSSHWSLNGTTYDITFSLDFTANRTETVAGTTLTQPMMAAIHDPKWTGLFQFILKEQSSIVWIPTFSSATFAGKAHKWHTGSPDFPTDRRGRVVHDYITGQPYLSDEAVEDGYREGVMVHPDNYDPPDPLDTDTYTPPPGEGVIDDTVTDVE